MTLNNEPEAFRIQHSDLIFLKASFIREVQVRQSAFKFDVLPTACNLITWLDLSLSD